MDVDPDDLDVMIRTLSGECRSESHTGKVAVAWVIRTRAQWMPPAWWGHTVGKVCLKKSQFSCWSDAEWNANNKAHMIGLKVNDTEYLDLSRVCTEVLFGEVIDPTGGATHYKVTGTPAKWDSSVANLHPVAIGHHSFYRLGPHG